MWSRVCARALSTSSRPFAVTLLRGSPGGVGPELTECVQRVFAAAKIPVEWDEQAMEPAEMKLNNASFQTNGGRKHSNINFQLPEGVRESIQRTGVVFKGPYHSPFAAHPHNMVPVRSPHVTIPAIPGPGGLRFSIICENIEDFFTGLEHEVVPDVVETIKVITEENALRIADMAFRHASQKQMHTVVCVHKANIMKLTDGLFLRCCQATAKKYPEIKFRDLIVDNASMQMVAKPQQFQDCVLVTPNLYGGILSAVGSALVGGMLAAGNYGQAEGVAVFEQGGRDPNKAQAGRNLANPVGSILSGAMMLKHLGDVNDNIRIKRAITQTLQEMTPRVLGGNATQSDIVNSICEFLSNDSKTF